MKKADLIEIIREVVKEELKASVKGVIRETLMESFQITGTSSERVAEASRLPPKKVAEPVAKLRAMKTYSTDPILNAVLNETVGGVPNEEGVASVQDMTAHIPKQVLEENTAVAAVTNALTRDYRSILKAADEKAKRNRP